MKKIFQVLFIFLATGLPVFGQGSQIARPIPRVSSFPATCTQYDLVQYTGASNPGLYVCGASNNWTYQGAGGTVTSVGLAMPSVFTVTNSPVTDAANLTAAWASGQTAGRVLGTPAGATGAVDLVQIANGHVAASAAIDYSKLNLAGSILNADISNSAAITNAKLANSAVTIGSTSVSLGATAATIAGLTLTTPTIADFTNATHNHTNAAGGGQITTSALSGLGTGVATALAVNVGSAGAPVLVNGAGGTPSSLTLTNAIGLPPATGISGWPANAAGVLTNDGSGNYSWGGGGTTINSTNGQVPYRVNSTTFGDSAISSNALNATGISVTSAAAGSGVTIGVTSSGSNEGLLLAPKGTGGTASNNQFMLNGLLVGSLGTITTASADYSGGEFRFRAPGGASGMRIASNQVDLGVGFELAWTTGAGYTGTRDIALARLSAGVLRLTNASTGAGQLLIGTSTDTADAQLSVYSQSTTRPSLKLRALSGTPGSQNVFESYNAANANTFGLTSDGAVTMGDGAALSNTPLTFNVGRGVNNPYVLGYRVSSIDHLLLGATNSSSTGITSAGIVMLSDKSVSWQANSTWSASATDLSLYRDAANTLAQRNGTNAQTFRIYNTYTSGSNYERLGIQASSNAFFITPEAATGTVRELAVGAAGSVTRIRSSLATPSAPALADGDWWVECSGTSPTRTCSILVRDTGATRTIATSVAF